MVLGVVFLNIELTLLIIRRLEKKTQALIYVNNEMSNDAVVTNDDRKDVRNHFWSILASIGIYESESESTFENTMTYRHTEK